MITKISKGLQITIPAEFRNKLDLEVGSKIEIDLKDNKIIISPIDEDLEKLFKEARKTKPKLKLTAEQMDKLAENGIPR